MGDRISRCVISFNWKFNNFQDNVHLMGWRNLTMTHPYRAAAAMALAACLTSCGDSNPFVGKWVLADNSQSAACMKALAVTEKSLRSEQGIWLYTLVEDGDDYIFDTKGKTKMIATVGKDDTIILNTGQHQCTMRRK
jgi:hypothetical protein